MVRRAVSFFGYTNYLTTALHLLCCIVRRLSGSSKCFSFTVFLKTDFKQMTFAHAFSLGPPTM